jgi:hypothetical protein
MQNTAIGLNFTSSTVFADQEKMAPGLQVRKPLPRTNGGNKNDILADCIRCENGQSVAGRAPP